MTTPLAQPDSDPKFNIHAALGTSDGLNDIWKKTCDEIARHGYVIKPLPGAATPVLGTGGFATVVYAEHTQTHAPAAVKVFIDPANENVVSSFDRERKTLEAPDFPRQFAAFARGSWHATDDQNKTVAQPFIVLEYLRGKPIVEYAEEQELSTHRRVQLIEELLHGVEGLHAKNLMHRDIKPGNIHVDASGHLKLLDYGLAGEISKVSGATTVAARGTELYSPPEVSRSDRRAEPKDDIYNCTTTAIHLITNTLPPANVTRAGDAEHLTRCRNLLREKGCDRTLRAILLKGLDAPERRFATPQAMADALYDWRVRAPRRRRRFATIAAVGAVLAIVVGVLWSSLVQTRRELQLREWFAIKAQTAQLAFSEHAAVAKLLNEARGLETEHERQLDAGDKSAAAATLGQAIERLRQAQRVSQGLARTQPRREALGIPLIKFPWVLAAPAIAQRKRQLDEQYDSITRLLADGQIDEADRRLDDLQRDLALLCEDSINAGQTAAAQAAYDALKDSAAPRLRDLDGFQTIDRLAADARTDWQAGHWDQATRVFGQARQNLETWLAKNESTEERAAREKSNQLAMEALQNEKQQLEGRIQQLTADRDAMDKQIHEQLAQIAKLNAERLEVRDTSNQRMTTLQSNVEKLKTERDLRQSQIDQLAKEKSGLAEQLVAARDDTKKAEQQTDDTRKQFESEKHRADNLQAALAAASAGGSGDASRGAAALADLKNQIDSVSLDDWQQAHDALVVAARKHQEVEQEKKAKLVDYTPESPTIRAINARIAEHLRLLAEALKKRDQADAKVFNQFQDRINAQQSALDRLTKVDGLRDTAAAVQQVKKEIARLALEQAPYKAGSKRAAGEGPAVDPLDVAKELPPAPLKPGESFPNSIGMKFVSIPAGNFMMGSPDTETDRSKDEGPQRRVTIKAFRLGGHEVTQKQYESVMGGGKNPSNFTASKGGGPDHPVEQVSWDDAQEFCRKLSALPAEKAAGRKYRLPTEAEWEYACRAGNEAAYSFGADAKKLGEYAWVSENSSGKTHPVGTKKPNAFGLFDMHGNVWEWCQDKYHDNYTGAPTDGSAWESGDLKNRVLRGGSWNNLTRYTRSAYRSRNSTDLRYVIVGFRVVVE